MTPLHLAYSTSSSAQSGAKGGSMGGIGATATGDWNVQFSENGTNNSSMTALPVSGATTKVLLYVAAAMAVLWFIKRR